MLCQKSIQNIKEGLTDRSIKFNDADTKKELLDKLWEGRKVKNPK